MPRKTHFLLMSFLLAGVTSLTCSCGSAASLNPGQLGTNSSTLLNSDQSLLTMEEPDRLTLGLGDADYITWFSNWLSRHLSVEHGENYFDMKSFISGSSGVYSYAIIGPKSRISLPPAPADGMSHVRLGVRNVPTGEIMRRIKATLHVDARDAASAEFFLAYSNYDTGRFQWSGPYSAADGINITNWWTDNVNDNNRGYLVFGVRGNQYPAELWSASVNIGPTGPAELP